MQKTGENIHNGCVTEDKKNPIKILNNLIRFFSIILW